MHRTESKIIDVRPFDEQQTIDLMQKFAWNLFSSQTLEDPKRFAGQQFTKLVFQRDLENPNLQKVKQLELQYEALSNEPIHVPAYTNTDAIPFWSAVASLVIGWYLFSFVVGIILAIIVGCGLWFITKRKNLQLDTEYQKAEADYENTKEEILQKASQL